MAKPVKELTPVRLPIASIIIDRTLNVRDASGQGYNVDHLKSDLLERGQQEPAWVEKMPDGTYRPIKGFRRATAIAELASAGAIDPLTGKPFNEITAIVHENLSELERLSLNVDHGQRMDLNRVEVFFAVERAVKAQATEKFVVTILRDLLERHYPPTRKIEPPTPENYLDYYRGVIQAMKRMALAPTVLRDVYVKNLRGEQAWPTKNDRETLFKVFQKEQEADTTNSITRSNPGPLFTQAWEKYLNSVEEAAASGSSRPKAISMMPADQVKKLKPASESRILKTVVDVITRAREGEVWMALDLLLVSVESKMTDEDKAKLDAILATPVNEAVPQA